MKRQAPDALRKHVCGELVTACINGPFEHLEKSFIVETTMFEHKAAFQEEAVDPCGFLAALFLFALATELDYFPTFRFNGGMPSCQQYYQY